MKSGLKILKQAVMFDASSHEVFELLMDSKKHAAFTGDSAKISRKSGSSFSAYGGYIEGKNIEIVPDKKIVQSWRASDWEEGHFSKATFEFKELKGKTKMTFTQENIPASQFASIKQGWIDFYWNPMKDYLAQLKR